MRLKSLATGVAVIAAGLLYAGSAAAAPMGNLTVANCSAGGVTIGATAVDWLPVAGPGIGCIDTGAGTLVISTNGPLLPGVVGDIKNLNLSSALPVDQFMTFASGPLDWILTSIGPGSSNTTCTGLTLGASCSISGGSPFVLTNMGKMTAISFDVAGTISDASGTSTWDGLFTTQIANQTAAQIQSILLDGGTITSTNSGAFTVTAGNSGPPIPEPATLTLLGAALAGFGAFRRNKKRI